MARFPQSLILAIDIGSSSVRTAFFFQDGQRIVRSVASREYSVSYSADGGAELEPSVLLRAVRGSVDETLAARKDSIRLRRLPIVALSGSAFWHSLLGLDRNGHPVTPVFTWADSRSTSDAAELREEFSERRIQQRTGCVLRAPFWPAKLRWLRRARPRLFARVEIWTSPARWIFGELFGVSETSHSMASGTGLYNFRRGTWDAELSAACHLRPDQLGELSSSKPAGNAARKELRDAVIFTALGDGAASNLGSGADEPGAIAINIGTSSAARMILPRRGTAAGDLPLGFFNLVVDDARQLVGGAISNGGNLRRWCLRELQLGAGSHTEKALSRTAAADDRLTVLPFWVQERAPTWPEGLRGTVVGLTPVSSASDILRATTTSTFYRLAAIVDQLSALTSDANEVIVSGGILHSPASLAILADALGRDVRVCREMESSLRGAAIYALDRLGFQAKPLLRGKIVKHRPALSVKHRQRRDRQERLEKILTDNLKPLPAVR